MATRTLDRPLESAFVFRALRGLYRRRLTRRGQFLLWATLAIALIGIDTRRALVFMLFALAAPPLLVAAVQLLRRRPPIQLTGRLPARLTAGRAVERLRAKEELEDFAVSGQTLYATEQESGEVLAYAIPPVR